MYYYIIIEKFWFFSCASMNVTGSHCNFIIEEKIWPKLFLLRLHMKMWCWKMFKSGICLKNFIKPFNHSFNGLWILQKIPTGMWIMICTHIFKSSRIIIYSNFKEKSSSETLQILPLFSKNKIMALAFRSVATGSEFPVPGRFRVLQSRVLAGYGYTLKFETRVPGTLRVIGG